MACGDLFLYLRGGVAAALAASIALSPGLAFATPDAAAAASPSDRFTNEQLLTYAGQGDGEEGESSSTSPESSQSSVDPVVIIVQLEEGSSTAPNGLMSLFGLQTSTRDAVKRGILQLADEQGVSANVPAATSRLFDGLAALMSSEDASDSNLVEYSHAIEGFTIEAPASLLSSIRALDGVKNAFVEQRHRVEPQDSEASLDSVDRKSVV